MWRTNWVHPFDDGNGRTARAASYLVLCVKLGYRLPGKKSLIDLVTTMIWLIMKVDRIGKPRNFPRYRLDLPSIGTDCSVLHVFAHNAMRRGAALS
jgi:hypothetical protein